MDDSYLLAVMENFIFENSGMSASVSTASVKLSSRVFPYSNSCMYAKLKEVLYSKTSGIPVAGFEIGCLHYLN